MFLISILSVEKGDVLNIFLKNETDNASDLFLLSVPYATRAVNWGSTIGTKVISFH